MSFLANTLRTTLGFLAMIVVVVTVHELGHLLAAVAFGVTVDSFSIGFGPELFGFDAAGIHWQVSAIPLGGYVSFPVEAGPGIVLLDSIAVIPKIIILSAGVVANALLAIAITLVLRARYGNPASYTMPLNMRGFLIVPFIRNAGVTLKAGGPFFWWFVASTSLDLMIFNALFIFPLDGGRIYFTLIYDVLGLQVSEMAAIFAGLFFSLFVMQGLLVRLFLPLLKYVRHAGIAMYLGKRDDDR